MNNGLNLVLMLGEMMSYDELIDFTIKGIEDYKEAKLLNDLERIKAAKSIIECNCMLIMHKATGKSAESTIEGIEKTQRLIDLTNPSLG